MEEDNEEDEKEPIFVISKPCITFRMRCSYCGQTQIKYINKLKVTCNDTKCKGSRQEQLLNPAENNPQTYLYGIFTRLIENGSLIVQATNADRILAENVIKLVSRKREEGGIQIAKITYSAKRKTTYIKTVKCMQCQSKFKDWGEKEVAKCPHCGSTKFPKRKQRLLDVLHWRLELYGDLL